MSAGKLCDGCLEFMSLLQTYDGKRVSPLKWEDVGVTSEELETILLYLQSWSQSHCNCCFRAQPNLERVNWAVQVLILAAVEVLKHRLKPSNQDQGDSSKDNACEGNRQSGRAWDISDKEKLFSFVSKVFLSGFPLYLAKHHIQPRGDDVSVSELRAQFLDMNELEASPYLFLNLSLFCKVDGLGYLVQALDDQCPENLPVQLVGVLVNVASNIKMWLNFPALLKFYVPFRRNVLLYLEKIIDIGPCRALVEYIWNTVKDPADPQLLFDFQGLNLALQYLCSPILTMRLAGMCHITNQVNILNEVVGTKQIGSVTEKVVKELTAWILENKLISTLFGPNLHVELVKQSGVLVEFLAFESKLSTEDLDVIWQAAMLKHCSKQVFDVLHQVIYSLNVKLTLHLKHLLDSLEPQDHTTQSISLGCTITRYIWLNMKEVPLTPPDSKISKKGCSDGALNGKTCNGGSSELGNVPFSREGNSCSDVREKEDPAIYRKMAIIHSDDASENESSSPDSEKSDDDENPEQSSSGQVETHSDSDADGEKSGNEDDKSSTRKKLRRKNRKASRKLLVHDCRNEIMESSAVISELSSLVQMAGPFISPLQHVADVSDDGSCSSKLSNKNMADFDGEESGDDEGLCRSLAAKQLVKLTPPNHLPHFARKRRVSQSVQFDVEVDKLCQNGETLLWDLIQDDKIDQLPEGLGIEVQAVLINLLCFNADRSIREVFIKGCIKNIAQNRSTLVALRLLPKLLTSFHTPTDIHQVMLWAEMDLNMTRSFFKNLKDFLASGPESAELRSHVQARLDFLSLVFSSPDFRLTLEQVDDLWTCLADKFSDQFFNWINAQIRMREHQALSLPAFRHIFTRKIPSLPPRCITMEALKLFQELCDVARTSNEADMKSAASSMDYLWKIALLAESTDVSLSAIQYLNSYYISQNLENEEEFIERCMSHLLESTKDLTEAGSKEITSPLVRVQRAILLLKAHIECFQRRYAYYLRTWQLEGNGIGFHSQLACESGSVPVRVVIQPAGYHEKCTLTLQSTDLIAHVKAEVCQWWKSIQQCSVPAEKSTTSSVLGALLTDCNMTVTRMISQGIEITDYDEKCLSEIPIKDMQLVYVSMGVGKSQRKRDSSCYSVAPPRDKLPMVQLLQGQYFEQLFSLMQCLASLTLNDKMGGPHTKAQVLSRTVWEILMLLPTNPTTLDAFVNLDQNNFKKFLQPDSPHKLIYSLYIIEALVKHNPNSKLRNMGLNLGDCQGTEWKQKFIEKGGLAHLFDIFISGVLEPIVPGDWSEWNQDCLASLLKVLCFLGVVNEDTDCLVEQLYEWNDISRKKKRRKLSTEKQWLPRLNEIIIGMMEVDLAMERLTTIFLGCAAPRDPNYYKTGFWGRAQVVHYAMSLLTCWAFSCERVRPALFMHVKFGDWIRGLVLEDPEPAVRREICTGLYKLCLGAPVNGKTGNSFIPELTSQLLKSLPISLTMKPRQKLETCDDGKEPYGQTNRDYFWLVCRLLDSLDKDFVKESLEKTDCVINLDQLAHIVSKALVSRENLETRHSLECDDGLVGLLNICTILMKYNLPFKESEDGRQFMTEVFDCLFVLPSPQARNLPKCKSPRSRASAFDFLVEMAKENKQNYYLLQNLLLSQHQPKASCDTHWEYWPRDNQRSSCGYVGLTNLGATCYMASAIQHLYMMPEARNAILSAELEGESRHEQTFKELQRMFAYLLESEKKTFNPRNFCKVYQMDHKPLNTGEQKDMAEFWIDLVSKLEEMTPDLKKLVRQLFCGTLSNNVVSLDCEHVSTTCEEFYTVRCQVANMRNIYESLNEVTVKDTLEGLNAYTCGQCGKKVRAEKRACFKKLPRIICFNVQRYTFNMVTMMKEKVNSEFSFPLYGLDMSAYTEQTMMPKQYQEERNKEIENIGADGCDFKDEKSFKYDLIGVTVHTGTADGGHYYCFIRDHQNKWLFFNDAEVKAFDSSLIPSECFGGEASTKTYDSLADKFMDFSFEKSHSAYMLFYERQSALHMSADDGSSILAVPGGSSEKNKDHEIPTIRLNTELEEWIWKDNTEFLRDKNLFEHTYFNFMWHVCGCLPQTLGVDEEVLLLATKLSVHFFLETLIHARERPTLVQWIELLTKLLANSETTATWFLDYMTENGSWPQIILVNCPNQMIRQMFQRLCLHVVQNLRPKQANLYLKIPDCQSDVNLSLSQLGSIPRFMQYLLKLLEQGARSHLKHLAEYFSLLHDFCKLGDEECLFFINMRAIYAFVNFYLGNRKDEPMDCGASDEDEEDEDVISVSAGKNKILSLEKMVAMVAILVEKSRDESNALRLSTEDWTALAGNGKDFPFIVQQIKDSINLQSSRNMIFSMCRWNEPLAESIVSAIFSTISRHPDVSLPFFKMLTLLAESVCGPPGMPSFTELILTRILDIADLCPQATLDWLTQQVPKNKLAYSWCMSSMSAWVEHFLIGHSHMRVRNAAASLLVVLVPSSHFRQSYRQTKLFGGHPCREIGTMTQDALNTLHEIYIRLLNLLKPARHYVDSVTHGTSKLTTYFGLLTYFTMSRSEKLMFGPYFPDLWQLFHPKLSEPGIPCHHNKQALLHYWYHVCIDCPENVQRIVHNPYVTKQIAFNYILADHEDQEVVIFNRMMLPVYYGILRMCCEASKTFANFLSRHQNIVWAFRNITPYPSQYPMAVDELLKMMQIFVTPPNNPTDQDIAEIAVFKRNTLQLYLQILDGRSNWATMISAFRILIETLEDKLFVVCNNGISLLLEGFSILHAIHHEAAACHVTGEMVDLLTILVDILRSFRPREFIHLRNSHEMQIQIQGFIADAKEWPGVLRKLLSMLNTFNGADIRSIVLDALMEFLYTCPTDTLTTLVPLMVHCHLSSLENANSQALVGSSFPRRSHHSIGPKPMTRPPKPIFQMSLFSLGQENCRMLKGAESLEDDFEHQVREFYHNYHNFIDTLCRIAFMKDLVNEELVTLSAMVGCEGVFVNFYHFAKLWVEVLNTPTLDRKFLTMLVTSKHFVQYVEAVMAHRIALTNIVTYNFLCSYIPQGFEHLICTEQMSKVASSIVTGLQNLMANHTLDVETQTLTILGDLKALTLMYSSACNKKLLRNPMLAPAPSAEQILLLLQDMSSYVESSQKAVSQEQKKDDHPSKKRKLTHRPETSDSTSAEQEKNRQSLLRNTEQTHSEKPQLLQDMINILKITIDSFKRNIVNLLEQGELQDDEGTEEESIDADLDIEEASSS